MISRPIAVPVVHVPEIVAHAPEIVAHAPEISSDGFKPTTLVRTTRALKLIEQILLRDRVEEKDAGKENGEA